MAELTKSYNYYKYNNPWAPWPDQWTLHLNVIFLILHPCIAQTPKHNYCIKFYHHITLLIIQVGTLPQDILDQLLLQPEQQPSLQSISIEVKFYQQHPYLSHSLKVHPP